MINLTGGIVSTMIFLLLAATPVLGQHEHDNAQTAESYTLFDNLGDHAFSITTDTPGAQEFFDQGMRLYYGFNHAEAIRSFKEAQRLDSECAMCVWGEALAYGPNINLPMDADGAQHAFDAIIRAQALTQHASPVEKEMINALAKRYARIDVENRSDLDADYARAMETLSARYPQNIEIGVLYAEAVMTTMPWDYWTADKQPRPQFDKALQTLEFAMAENPEHPGACHFYIHAVEKNYPERAVPCAERLAELMPGAGHIVHMPGHIYIRVGRYADAIKANQHAVHADETYIQDRRPGMGVYTAGYYPHNYDFMAFAATMVGDCSLAIDAARNVRDVIPQEMISMDGLTFLQHYYTRPLQMLVGCQRWDEILDYEEPADELEYARMIWHYARGRARAEKGDLSGARSDLAKLKAAREVQKFEGVTIEPNSATDVLAIAELVLEGWIEFRDGNSDAAFSILSRGVEAEDSLLYGEPPEWSIPVRHDLGAMQLKDGDASAAEETFRQALEKFPRNYPATNGLANALTLQGRTSEAESLKRELD